MDKENRLKARAIYETLLKEYPQDSQQIKQEWQENPSLENMEELREHEETFG